MGSTGSELLSSSRPETVGLSDTRPLCVSAERTSQPQLTRSSYFEHLEQSAI